MGMTHYPSPDNSRWLRMLALLAAAMLMLCVLNGCATTRMDENERSWAEGVLEQWKDNKRTGYLERTVDVSVKIPGTPLKIVEAHTRLIITGGVQPEKIGGISATRWGTFGFKSAADPVFVLPAGTLDKWRGPPFLLPLPPVEAN